MHKEMVWLMIQLLLQDKFKVFNFLKQILIHLHLQY